MLTLELDDEEGEEPEEQEFLPQKNKTAAEDQVRAFQARMAELERLVEDQATQLVDMEEMIEERVRHRVAGLKQENERLKKRQAEEQVVKHTAAASPPRKSMAERLKRRKLAVMKRDPFPSLHVRSPQPYETELPDVLNKSKEELRNMIGLMAAHIETQDEQLEEAEKMLNQAIQERNEASEAAQEAFLLSIDLDQRLQRSSYIVYDRRDSDRSSVSRRHTSPEELTTAAEDDILQTPRNSFS